jgi:cytoskeleton protein RodZ
MPLDTGELTQAAPAGAADPRLIDSFAPTLEQGAHIGEALKASREYRGVTLEQLAETTRVRRAYLAALEEMRHDQLPSRPFTMGYIRAYARALGLDGDLAVARFKASGPVADAPLSAPVGVERGPDNRVTAAVVAGLLIVVAIVAWNVARRFTAEPPPAAAPEVAAVVPDPAPTTKAPSGGAVSLGAPLPAPVESTTPTPYETPGLAAAAAAGGSADASLAAAALEAAKPKPDPALEETATPKTFVAKGTIYGAADTAGGAVLQAKKPASVVVHGPDGSVYFARQLAEGEAYRVPSVAGLILDVSEPEAFDVFVGGTSKGALTTPQTPVSKLTAD